jgi:hypothetical protein
MPLTYRKRPGGRPAPPRPEPPPPHPEARAPRKPPSDGRASKHPWERIRAAHNTGRYTIAQLCEKFGVDRNTVYARKCYDTKRDPNAWAVDLSPQVERATQALLLKAQAAAIVTEGQAAAAGIIEIQAAAQAATDVILGHRKDITQQRNVIGQLVHELGAVTARADDIADVLTKVNEHLSAAEARIVRAQFADLAKLHARAATAQRLADATVKLQAAERRAFGLSDDGRESDPFGHLTDAQLLAEIGRLAGELERHGLPIYEAIGRAPAQLAERVDGRPLLADPPTELSQG